MVTHVFISPHFDDVVGSCAGAIQRLRATGSEVRVLTVFGGRERPPLSDVAEALHGAWGFEEVVASRRSEDERACRVLDCIAGSLDFPDSIYRADDSGRYLYPTFSSLSGEPDEVDRDLPARIAECLDQIVPASGAIIYCPSAVGQHVDHVITRRAVEFLAPERAPVIYYREFYYDRFADGAPPPKSQVVTATLEPDEVAAKIAAFAAYASQIKGLFGSDQGMRNYFTTNGRVEEFFVPRTTPPALRDELLRTLRAKVGSRQWRMVVQALTASSRRRNAAAMLGKPAQNTPGALVHRLISRAIRLVRGVTRRLSGKPR
jgi:LmbE family N-acetylglucosaminyl deacetylase